MAISRRRRLLSIFAMFLGMALLASGCTKAEPKPTPTPTKTAIFSSEEAALQAAVDVYQEFNATLDKLSATNPETLDALEPVVTADFLSRFTQQFESDDSENRTEGSTSFRNEQLLNLEQTDRDSASVTLGVCRDLSTQKVLDSEGNDVTDETRKASVVPLQVDFVWNSDSSTLLVDRLDVWQNANC
ncbi:hypothetical protein ACSAGD_11930 [Paramicrobacterium sp. CJ85]|uniref:hypothetical protein n=1 Tax=Paramicrobacterium sp. CJ85 TaxID=3445355 RepID=UPI003F63CA88